MDSEKLQAEIADKLKGMSIEEQLKFLTALKSFLTEANTISREYLADLKKAA